MMAPRSTSSRRILAAVLRLLEQRGVVERLRGDLGESLKQVEMFEPALMRVEQADEADRPRLVSDQRETNAGRQTECKPVVAVGIGQPRVGLGVFDHEGQPGRDRRPGGGVTGGGVADADVRRDETRAVDTHQRLQRVAVEAVDIAGVGVDEGAHALGDRAQDLVDVEARPELKPRLDQQGQPAVAVCQLFDEQGLLQRAGDDLADALEEVETSSKSRCASAKMSIMPCARPSTTSGTQTSLT